MNKYYSLALLLSGLLLFGCDDTEKNDDTGGSDISEGAILSESSVEVPSVSEDCTDTVDLDERTTIIKPDQYALIFPTDVRDYSSMTYCSDKVEDIGAAFEIDYVDPGGSGMDGYVNGLIGGVNKGSWQAGDFDLMGMPVKLSELNDSMIIQWKVSQGDNAWDTGDNQDKWMASINMKFGAEADAKTPDSERDYDVVIEANSFNFNDSTEDSVNNSGKKNKRNYFARYEDGSLRTFDIIVDGKTYKYAVRYKFYNDSGDRNNKVHVKYLPMNEENIPPYLNHSLKAFVDNSKEYIQYANMLDDERALAHEKVALPDLYLKSVSAGYEVYHGESTLRNDYFRIVFE